MKNFHIITFGCKLNIYESESIIYNLQSNGLVLNSDLENSDIIIINSCTVTSKADSKCRNIIRKSRKINPDSIIIVCGCLVDTNINDLLSLKEINIFVENKNKDQIYKIINNYDKVIVPYIYRDDNDGSFNFKTYQMSNHSRAFLKIQDGCDNACTYCKIPMARGKGRSRDIESIYNETDKIIQNGYNEIILTGVNIGSYSFKNYRFTELLDNISEKFLDTRFRISSLEFQYIDDAFFEIFSRKNICSHIHVPIQSGSNKILKLMNRNYVTEEFLGKINRIRKIKKDPFISTDLIVGFPDEQEIDFQNTLDLISKADFSYIHQFGFSPRLGTKAYAMLQKIPERIRDERIGILKKINENLNLNYRKIFIAKELEVIIEKQKKEYFTGKSDNYLDISIKSNIKLEPKKIYKVIFDRIENNINWGSVV